MNACVHLVSEPLENICLQSHDVDCLPGAASISLSDASTGEA